jgi:hypothetical protein
MAEIGMFAVDEPGTESTGFDPVPPGIYPLIISDSEVVLTKNGSGRYLKLIHQIIDGPLKGRKLFNNLNLWNANAQTVQIAKSQLNALCKACGFQPGFQIQDSVELHNLPFKADVGLDKGSDEYAPQNKIKRYIYEETVAATTAGVAKQKVAAATKVKPPWAK